jgi:hypothetical protein
LKKCKSSVEIDLYIACACAGRIASLAFANREFILFEQEQDSLKSKESKEDNSGITNPKVLIPDNLEPFNISSLSGELSYLSIKIEQYYSRIEKHLSDSNQNSETQIKNLHLYCCSMFLISCSLSSIDKKYLNNKSNSSNLYDLCSSDKIIYFLDKILDIDSKLYNILYFKTISKIIPLMNLNSAREIMEFSRGKTKISDKDHQNSITNIDTILSSSKKNTEILLLKSLILSLTDKKQAVEFLDKYLKFNSSISIVHLFKSEMLFQLDDAKSAFDEIKQSNFSPIIGDFSFEIPIRFEMKSCFKFLNWSSGLMLGRSLSILFSLIQEYFSKIKPEEIDANHISYAEISLNSGLRALNLYPKYKTGNYQELRSTRSIQILGIINVYNAYEIIKKSNSAFFTQDKNDFLEKHAQIIEYVKKIDNEITK